MRVSQVLPVVRCSKCNASISMDDMATHTCDAKAPLTSIAEYATSGNRYTTRHNEGGLRPVRPQRRRPPELELYDQGLFNADRYAKHELDSHTARPVMDRAGHPVHGQRGPTTSSSSTNHTASSAHAVLGRLNNLKTGVLDSKSLNRPIQQTRLGPIQTRDPRATMIPIRPDTRGDREYEIAPVPIISPLWNHPEMQPFSDDNASVISGRSQASSGRTRPGTAGRLRTPQEEVFPSSLSNSDSGPFHHVSSRLDPTIFVPLEESKISRKANRKQNRPRNKSRKDVYDDDWEEQGIEHDSVIAESIISRPSTAGSPRAYLVQDKKNRPYGGLPHPTMTHLNQREGPRRDAGSVTHETYEYNFSRDGQSYAQMPERAQLRRGADQDQSNFDTRPRKNAENKHNASHPHRGLRPDNVSTKVSRLTNDKPEPVRTLQPISHSRHETSSSLGTVLTSSTMLSVRSSVSSPPTSPPTSEVDYHAHKAGFDEAVTSRPGVPSEHNQVQRNAELTPKAVPRADRTGKPQPRLQDMVQQEVKRSETTESFDRLLRDIGSSIDELDAPSVPFVETDGSPSSTYSPVKPTLTIRPDMSERLQALPQRLGSPASLQSKETASSHGSSNNHSRAASRSKIIQCRGCSMLITGKSISSADGKLTGKYHKECFKCAHQDCRQSSFPNGEFYVFDDRPYCSMHYHATAGSACAYCGEGIEGNCIATADNKRYHLHCHNDNGRAAYKTNKYGAF